MKLAHKMSMFMLVLIMIFACYEKCDAKPVSDFKIVKQTCLKYYGHNNIRIVKGYSRKTNKIISTRRNKPYIVVERIVSISHGRNYGYDKNGYYIKYNKNVKKGKKVVSYCIYNPYTNFIDDVSFVVDNKIIR